MSWYGVPVYSQHSEPTGWVKLCDSLDEAARYLQTRADPEALAVEMSASGEPTGVVMRWDPSQAVRPLGEAQEDDLTTPPAAG